MLPQVFIVSQSVDEDGCSKLEEFGIDIETWYNVQIVKADKATHGLHVNEVADFHDRKQ